MRETGERQDKGTVRVTLEGIMLHEKHINPNESQIVSNLEAVIRKLPFRDIARKK